MNSQRFFKYYMGLIATLNIVQFANCSLVFAREPNVLDVLEANVQFFEKQVPSLVVRNHSELEGHWAYRSLIIDSFNKAKSEIETLSHKPIAREQNLRFADRIVNRYFGLQTRLYLAYARVAHLRPGLEPQFSFKNLEKFNLKIFKESAETLRIMRAHNVRHVDHRTVELFLTSQDEQLAEFAALMNPKTESEYLMVLQFSALRSGIVNRWALDQAYLSQPAEQLFYCPVNRFLSFQDLSNKTISQMRSYQELNADMRLEGFLSLKPEMQKILRSKSILKSVGVERALVERLLSLPSYFRKNQFNTVEDNLSAAVKIVRQIEPKIFAEWDLISENVIDTSNFVGDVMSDNKYPALVDRLLESSFGYLNNLISFYLTEGMIKSGYVSDSPEREYNLNQKMISEFKEEWILALRPKLMELVKTQVQNSWKEIKKSLHHEKIEFMRKSILDSIWTWNILLDIKNAKSSVIAELKSVPENWKLVTLQSAQDAKHYFFRAYHPTGISFIDLRDQEWALKFFDAFESKYPGALSELDLKLKLKLFLSEYTNKSIQEIAAEMELRRKNPETPQELEFKKQFKPDPRDEIKRVFYLDDSGSKILREISEYQDYAVAKREALLSKVGVLRLLRLDDAAMSRIKIENQKQIKAYDDFMSKTAPHRDRYDNRELFRPKPQEADDLLLSLVRAWKESPSILITADFLNEIKLAYDGARLSSTGKLEKFFMIHDLTQSKSNADHRLLLQSTEQVRQTFIQSSESFKKLDESLMKQTRSVVEKLDDMLENVVLYVFYAIIVVGAATLVVASDGVLAPLLQGLLSAGVITINVLGVANVVTRTTVDFYVLPPQLEYQRDYANYLAVSSKQESQQGDVSGLSAKQADQLQSLDQKGQTLDHALSQIEDQQSDRSLGIVWSTLDMTGIGEFIKPLKPLSKMGHHIKSRIISYRYLSSK